MMADMKAQGRTVLRGEDAFKLYDTYGFPLDLTEDVLQEAGLAVDAETFAQLMDAQRKRARAARENLSAAGGWDSTGLTLENVSPTKFTGYESLAGESPVTAIVVDGEQTGVLEAGQSGIVVTAETPFYAESGGQVGDRGEIRADGALFEVTDTQKNAEGRILPYRNPARGASGNRRRGGTRRRRCAPAGHCAQPLVAAPSAGGAAPCARRACRAGGLVCGREARQA